MVVQYDSKNNKWSTWKSLFKEKIPNVSEEATTAFNEIKNAANSTNPITDFEKFIEQQDLADESLKNFLRDTNYATKDLATYKQYLKDTGQETTRFAKFTQGALGALKSFGAMALNMGAATLISMIIGGAISGLKSLANSIEETEKKSNSMANSLNEFRISTSKSRNTISELNDKYLSLSQGVGALGQNISLSDEQYKEYKNIISEISELMPNLTVKFNEQGEKIGFTSGQLQNLNKEYDKYIQKQAKDFLAKGNDEGTIDDMINNINNSISNDLGGRNVNNFLAANLAQIQDLFGMLDLDDVKSIWSSKQIISQLKWIKNKSKQDLVKYLNDGSNSVGVFEDIGAHLDASPEMTELIIGYTGDQINDFTSEQYEDFINNLDNLIISYEDKISNQYEELKYILDMMFKGDNKYLNLSEDEKKYISSVLSNLDQNTINNLGLVNPDGDFVKQNLYSFVKNIINFIESCSPEVKKAFNDLYSFDIKNENISTSEIQRQITQNIQIIQKALKEKGYSFNYEEIEKIFGLDSLINQITELQNRTMTKMNDKNNFSIFDKLSLDDLKIAANLEIKKDTLLSWDELLEKIKEAKSNLPKKSVDLSQFDKQIQAAQKSVKTIDSAMDKIMEGKSFDDSEILALLKDFPELGKYIDLVNEDFTGLQKGLEEVRKESLNDLISQLEKAAETADEKTAPALQTCIDLFKQMQNGTFNKNSTQKSFIDIKNIEDDVKLAEDKVRDAKANIVDGNKIVRDWIRKEGQKIGLDNDAVNDYINNIKDGSIASKFGNIDVSKRKFIIWSDELKKLYEKELASWNFNPEIETASSVYAMSEKFKYGNTDCEITYSPILQTDKGAVFLSRNNVTEYINEVLKTAATNGKGLTFDNILKIDAEGTTNYKVGDNIVTGLIGGITLGENTNSSSLNGISASLTNMLITLADKYGVLGLIEKEAAEATDELSNAQKRLQEISKSSSYSAYTLKELDKLTDGFSQLDKIYADVYDKEDFDFGSVVDDKFIETFGKYKEEYENFTNTIAKSPDDINACQSAFNDLVGAWLYGQDVIKNLNEENKNAAIAYLEQNGIVNAAEIVTQRLAAAKEAEALQSQFAKDNAIQLSAASTGTATAFIEKAGACDTAKLEMAKLVAANIEFNNTGLSVEKKINSLQRLANAAHQTAFATQLAIRMDGVKNSSLYQAGEALGKAVGLSDKDFSNNLLKSVYDEAYNDFQNLKANDLKLPQYSGGSATNSAKSKGSGSDKGSGGSKTKKEHEVNDNYYNFTDAKVKDEKKKADKLKEDLDEINEQIDFAYSQGNIELANKLEEDLSKREAIYRETLSKSAAAVRDMGKNEVLPLVYELAPELKGKNFDEFTEEEKLTIKKRLEDEIVDIKNKKIDLENAGNENVSDEEVKAAEKKLKILEEQYSTLEEIYNLVGTEEGKGEFAKAYRESLTRAAEQIKNSLDKELSQIDIRINMFEDMGDFGGQIDALIKQNVKIHEATEKLRNAGLEENAEAIQTNQGKYRENFKKIFEILNSEFDKSMKKIQEESEDLEFNLNFWGSKDYDEQEENIRKQLELSLKSVADYDDEISKLTESYRNNSITGAEYEERLRSLREEQQNAASKVKEYYEALRDLEISKIDDQIEDIERATEKQTKAIDDQISELEKLKDELDDLKNLYDRAYKAVQKLVGDQIDDLNELKEQEEEYYDKKLEDLDKINEETKRGIELSEKKEAIEKASQRTALVYHEDKGWVHEANPNDLSEAQRDLDQWLIDDQIEQAKKSIEEQKEAAIKAIDDQIEAWNKYLEKWEDAINAYEEGQNKLAAIAVIGKNWEESTLAQREDVIRKFGKEYYDICSKLDSDSDNSYEKQIDNLNKQKDALEKASEEQIEALNNIKSAWEELFDSMTTASDEWVRNLVEKFDLPEQVRDALLSMLSDYKTDRENVLDKSNEKLQYNNDDVMKIRDMINNSKKWANEDSEVSKEQLFEKNKDLAEQLSFHTYFDSHKGVWYDDNRNNIYSDEFLKRLEEQQEINEENIRVNEYNSDKIQSNSNITEENSESTKSNTDSTKDNTNAINKQSKISKAVADTINRAIDVVGNTADAINNKSSGNTVGSNSGSSSGGNSSGSSSSPSLSGNPYTYSSELKGTDVDTAAEWFKEKHKTNPGTNITVISGGISTLSSDLINQLGLKSGDLVVLGKQLYHITNSGYSKITGSLVNKYAKGSEYIPYNQYALVDEEGPELHAHKNSQGRITHLEKGDEIVPAKDTNTLASLVDYVNDPKNTNDPETDHLAKIIEASKKIQQNFSIYSLFEYSTLNPYEQIMKSVTPNIEYIVNNNQSTVNNNNYINTVELKNINNVDDIFRGLSNMAMQSTFKR